MSATEEGVQGNSGVSEREEHLSRGIRKWWVRSAAYTPGSCVAYRINYIVIANAPSVSGPNLPVALHQITRRTGVTVWTGTKRLRLLHIPGGWNATNFPFPIKKIRARGPFVLIPATHSGSSSPLRKEPIPQWGGGRAAQTHRDWHPADGWDAVRARGTLGQMRAPCPPCQGLGGTRTAQYGNRT